jgi:hypothetical protein
MSRARKEAVLEDERRYGPRKDLSARSVERTLRRGVELTQGLAQVELFTDKKSTYPGVAKRLFGEDRLVHHTTDSKLARMTWNPLFPINHTEAMTRDLMARLRRESWLVSKKRRYLDLCLAVWACWRNYVRLRFNRDQQSPAQMLGFVERRMTEEQLLSWRQDWRKESLHPLARGARSIRQYEARRQAA